MEKLRKVKFSLAKPELSLIDYDINNTSETVEKIKERNRLFHTFGNEPFWDSEKEEWHDRLVGVVEEVATGKV